MSKYITLDNLSQFLNQMKTGGYVASNNNYGGIKTGYTQTGYNSPVKLNSNGQAYADLSMAYVKDSLIQWDKADSNGVASRSNLSPIEIGLDSSRFANRLSFMNPDNITIQYSTNGGNTWTDYEAANSAKIRLVTSGFDPANSSTLFYCGKKSNESSQISTDRQKSEMDMLRITIKPVSYFSLRKILLNISSNGALKSYVKVEISTDANGVSYQDKGSYEISGWSGWNSIPLNMAAGGSGSSNAKYIRMTFFWNGYTTGYAAEYNAANASNTKAVTFAVRNISMHGENLWSNVGESNLARYGHIYKYDENQNTIFPKNVACAELTCGTLNSTALIGDNLTLRNKTQNHFFAAPADKNGNTTWRRIAPADLPIATTSNVGGIKIGTGLDITGESVVVKHDNKTLFAGDNAKDTSSITDSYRDHPLQLGKDYKWVNNGSNLSNLNNFTNCGIYNIFGEHTRNDDNLPIMNTGGGHTFSGRLFVYDSSLPNTGNAGNDCCITQVLTLSNRVGGDGNMYIRTASGSTKDNLTWSKWGKLQANVEVGQIHSNDIDTLIDNGIYSGVHFNKAETYSYDGAYFMRYPDLDPLVQSSWGTECKAYFYYYGNTYYTNCILVTNSNTPAYIIKYPDGSLIGHNSGQPLVNTKYFANEELMTFVLITVNNYAAAASVQANASCTQLKYGVSIQGQSAVQKRTGVRQGNIWSFGEWESLNEIEIPTATSTSVGGIKVASVRSTSPSLTYGSTTTGRYYGVELDKNGKAFVNVPWSDSTTLNITYSSAASWNSNLLPFTLYEFTNTALTSINITSFTVSTSAKVHEYGIVFNATSNTTFAWPSNVKWANGIQPCENGTAIGAGLWKILFTYTPGLKVYTATFAKYS